MQFRYGFITVASGIFFNIVIGIFIYNRVWDCNKQMLP